MRVSIFVLQLSFFTLSMMILSFIDQGHCLAVSCCYKYEKKEVTEPIFACYLQKSGRKCKINAVQLKVENGTKCISPKADWLPKTLKKNKIKCVKQLSVPSGKP